MGIKTSCSLLLLAATLAAGPVYDRVWNGLKDQPHRLPGSAEGGASLDLIEAVLKEQGLAVERQSFPSLVPEATRVDFQVDGKTISGLRPVAPNGIALVTTAGQTLEGPLYYLKDGGPDSTTNLKVDGAILLIDWGSPNWYRLTSMGARAIIFIGNDNALPGEIEQVFTGLPLTLVRAYLPRALAESQGLLDGKARTAKLAIDSRWADVESANLWIRIPGSGKKFALGRDEALVFSADLGSVGTVPGYCPDSRGAANAALLAETAVAMAKSKPDRTLFFVFFGDRYTGFPGARYFYWGVYKAVAHPDNPDPLPVRVSEHDREIAKLSGMADLLARKDLLTFDSPLRRDVDQMLRTILEQQVNEMNFSIYQFALARMSDTSIQISQPEAALKARKAHWNGLHEDLRTRRVLPERQTSWDELVALTRARLSRQLLQVRDARHYALDAQKVAEAVGNRMVTHHFEFSFADGTSPWFPIRATGARYTRWPSQAIGNWSRDLAAIATVANAIPTGTISAPLLADAIKSPLRPVDMSGYDSGSSSVAHVIGSFGYLFGSVGPAPLESLPVRVDHDLRPLIPQVTALLNGLATTPALSLRGVVDKSKIDERLTYRFKDGFVEGARVDQYARSSSVVEGPAIGAVIYQSPNALAQEKSLRHTHSMTRVLDSGYYIMPMIWREDFPSIAATHDEHGMINRLPESGNFAVEKRLWYGYGNGFLTPYLPGQETSIIFRPILLEGNNDSKFKENRDFNRTLMGKLSVIFAERDVRFKLLFGGLRILGSESNMPGGLGIGNDPMDMARLDLMKQGLSDFGLLNESRLAALRERNIYNNTLELLHAEAEASRIEANRLEASNLSTAARAQRVRGLALAEHVYSPLREVINDMVKAVVILLLLTIPFAFILERLLFHFTLITKQIVAFSVIFLGTFGLLYLVHPAFRLASTPVVIFLAFVIILLSGIVVWLIMNKFRQEVKVMQGMGASIHGRDSGKSPLGAAVLIGISGMRNRPLKTLLTATTVVLLTFTILVFASFTSRSGVRTTWQSPGTGEENRIEIRKHTSLVVEEAVRESVASLHQDRYDVYTRSAVFHDPVKNLWNQPVMERDLAFRHSQSGRVRPFEALLGLMPGEVEKLSGLRALLPGFGSEKTPNPPVYLSQSMMKDLGAKVGDEVFFQYKKFTIAGVFDSSRLQVLENLDGSKILPPNYRRTFQQNATPTSGDSVLDSALANMDASTVAWATADLTAIAPAQSLSGLDPVVNMVTLIPRTAQVAVADTAVQIARSFNYPIYGKGDDGTKQFFYTTTFSGSGLGDILIPLLIGGFIIFSSLLASIVDREKEIYTFTALGLAPAHVGALFFAESGAYAIIGGVGGYLFSQVVVKVMNALASTGLITAPELNFSSLSSVLTILLVMTTVMLSTIYPAVKASRSANPGISRKWRMPAPKGDRLSFRFPFTVSAGDWSGILGFLREHFLQHQDVAVGQFTAQEIALENPVWDGPHLARADLTARVSLAPFDLGVGQNLRISVVPTELPGIDEVQLDLERLSGSPGSWMRGNHDFVEDLRNQFLIWRSLPAESTPPYREKAEEALRP